MTQESSKNREINEVHTAYVKLSSLVKDLDSLSTQWKDSCHMMKHLSDGKVVALDQQDIKSMEEIGEHLLVLQNRLQHFKLYYDPDIFCGNMFKDGEGKWVMSAHWEMDMWKCLFGRLTIIFIIMQFIFTYWIWNNDDFTTEFLLISLLIFFPEYLISLVTYFRAREHEKERIKQEATLKDQGN